MSVPYQLNERAKKNFHFIAPHIEEGGSVLDFGSGEIGHYWALSYIGKVTALQFWDVSKDALQKTRDFLEVVSPEHIDSDYGQTVAFLKESGYLSEKEGGLEIATRFVEAPINVQRFDFLKDTSSEKFDVVMSVEALECVDSYEEFCYGLGNAKSLLKKDGKLLLIMTPYDELTPKVEEYINHGTEGRYNPNEENIRGALEAVGLSVSEFNVVDTGIYNYSTSYQVVCRA